MKKNHLGFIKIEEKQFLTNGYKQYFLLHRLIEKIYVNVNINITINFP